MSNGRWTIAGMFVWHTPWALTSSIPHIYLRLYSDEPDTAWAHIYFRS